MDPIALLTSAVIATMVSVLLFLLPGFALGPLILPGGTTPLARVGRAAGVSLLVALIACTVLARLGLLSALSIVMLLVGVSAVGVLARRPRLRMPALRGRRRAWWVAAAAGTILALGLIVIPSHVGVRPDLLPRSSTTWYYLHLAQATADLGAFPAQLGEWGALRPFPTDYLPVTAHTAGALLLLPGDQLVRLETYRLIILALGVLFATLLFRRWVSGWTALAGAILLLGTARLDQKFDGYRPETVGLVLALFTLWVADRALVERDRRLVAVAVIGAAVVFLAHGEVFLILAPALVGIGVARLLVAAGGRGRPLGLQLLVGRRRLAVPALAVAIVAGGTILGVASGWALTGESRVLGYAVGANGPPPELGAARRQSGEIPPGWTFTDDPTWDFYTASVAPSLAGTPPPATFIESVPRSIFLVWPGLDGRTRQGLVVLGALLVTPFLAWPFLDARRRRFLLGWTVFAALLIAGSIVLFAVSDTYVPQRTAGRRLMPYLLLLPVVAMTTVLWIVGRLSAPAWRALFPGGGRALAAGLALAILTAGAVSASARTAGAGDDREAALSPAGYDAYRWIAENLPADARILANAYTDGSIAAVTGRVGIVDGRAVYLEDPAFLAESTALCLGARVVFGTPAAPGAQTYLVRERVTHLLVATAGPLGTDLGGYLLFETDVAAIRADQRFRLVQSFGEGRLLLFEVVDPAAAAEVR